MASSLRLRWLTRAGFLGLLFAAFAAGWRAGRLSLPADVPASLSLDTSVIADLALVPQGEGWFADRPERLPVVAVRDVVDGDTVWIDWEGRPMRLRYYGVNTPERDQPCYAEATERNRVLAGTSVRLAFDERERDRYGRLLAYVFTEEGRSIDAQLVSEGLGRAWRRDGRFRSRMGTIEEDARRHHRGCLGDPPPHEKTAPARRSTRRKRTSRR